VTRVDPSIVTGADIVYVLDHYPVLSQTFVANEIDSLRRRGFKVAIVSLRRPSGAVASADIYVDRYPFRVLISHVYWLMSAPMKYFRYVCSLARTRGESLGWLLTAPFVAHILHGDQLVHVHFGLRSALVTRLVSALRPVRRSLTLHAIELFKNPRNLSFKCEDAHVITVSRFNAEYLKAHYGLDAEVAYCGVLKPEGPPITARDRDRNAFLCVGRAVEKKGFDLALMAVADLVRDGLQVCLNIVGSGPELPKLMSLAKELNVDKNICFLGAKPHHEVLAMMASARALVAPFRRAPNGDMDGLPLVVLEAMARGLPVISTQLSGLVEVIGSETAWPIEAPTADSVAAAIREFIGAPVTEASRRVDIARDLVHRHHSMKSQLAPMLTRLAGGTQ
jgi:colanic acid/amylovoran biosynthesis glycosyltransferase